MYAENGHIPEVENCVIWRYIDFDKFKLLLSTRELYFCPAARFEDEYEGSFAADNINSYRLPNIILNSNNEPVVLDPQELFEKRREVNRKLRETMHINCWINNNYESEAMWKLFLQGKNGIAIKSTVNRLKESINDSEHLVYIGRVKYIDYDNDTIPEDNLWETFLHKRRSLDFENEIRALVFKGYDPDTLPADERKCTKVSTKLETLIENIYIDPYSPAPFTDEVKSEIKKYNFSFDVNKSTISKPPLF